MSSKLALMLMRHAKSSWSDVSSPDEDRPLNKRGKHAAKFMGQYLRRHDLLPDAIISSTAVRAVETAKRVIKAADFGMHPRISSDLYLSGVNAHLAVIADAPGDAARLLLIGHNPDMESLIHRITGVHETMPTGAIAVIEPFAETWPDFSAHPKGKLLDVLRPRILENAADAH